MIGIQLTSKGSVLLVLVASRACPSPTVSVWCRASAPLWLEACLLRWHNAVWSACQSRWS